MKKALTAKWVLVLMGVLFGALFSVAMAQLGSSGGGGRSTGGGFMPDRCGSGAATSTTYSGSGPHIKNSTLGSSISVADSITLLGAQTAGSSTADVIAKPTNASRVGPVFEVQNSAGTAALQAYDSGRLFSLSGTNFNYLARATSTNAPGVEFKNSANTTVGTWGFAGAANAGVTGTAVGDAFFTTDKDILIGNATSGKMGERIAFRTVQTTDATVTNIYTLTLADDTVYQYNIFCTDRRSDVAGRSVFWRRGGSFRASAGAATEIAAEQTPAADQTSGTITASVAVNVSSNDLQIAVTGAAGQTQQWQCTIHMFAINVA